MKPVGQTPSEFPCFFSGTFIQVCYIAGVRGLNAAQRPAVFEGLMNAQGIHKG
jgi:hypothetical protein